MIPRSLRFCYTQRVIFLGTILGGLIAGSASSAHAWGERGHRVINRVGVSTLPADGLTFVQSQIDWIGIRGITPDKWRYPSEPFVKIDEGPNHGWFMEQFSFMRQIPRSRYEFVLALVRRAQAAGGEWRPRRAWRRRR